MKVAINVESECCGLIEGHLIFMGSYLYRTSGYGIIYVTIWWLNLFMWYRIIRFPDVFFRAAELPYFQVYEVQPSYLFIYFLIKWCNYIEQ